MTINFVNVLPIVSLFLGSKSVIDTLEAWFGTGSQIWSRSNFFVGRLRWRFWYRSCIIWKNARFWSIIQICYLFTRSWHIWFGSVMCLTVLHNEVVHCDCAVSSKYKCNKKKSVSLCGFMIAQKLHGENFSKLYILFAKKYSSLGYFVCCH